MRKAMLMAEGTGSADDGDQLLDDFLLSATQVDGFDLSCSSVQD